MKSLILLILIMLYGCTGNTDNSGKAYILKERCIDERYEYGYHYELNKETSKYEYRYGCVYRCNNSVIDTVFTQ